MRSYYPFVISLLLVFLVACSTSESLPPTTTPSPTPPTPPTEPTPTPQPSTPANTPPEISLIAEKQVRHHTLGPVQVETVTFTIQDVEDTEETLAVHAQVLAEPDSVAVTPPVCDAVGTCTLSLSVERTRALTIPISLTVTDAAKTVTTTTFNVVIAPEDKPIDSAADLKTLLETASPGSSFRLITTQPIILDTQFILNKEVSLFGVSPTETVLDVQSKDRHFWLKSNAKLSLHDMTLRNGWAKDDGGTRQGEPLGGSIFNEGMLELTKVHLLSSHAVSGGGLYTTRTGKSVIRESVIGKDGGRNIATRSGGGVFNNGGTVEIYTTDISFNQGDERGGGVFNFTDGQLLLEGVTLYNNFSWDGTALKNEEGSVIIRGSTLEKNVATKLEGGAVVNLRGDMEIYDSFLKNNETLLGSGGAIYNGTTSTMLIDNTVFENNRAAQAGGAIYNEVNSGLLELRKTKIITNSASREGGGVYNAGQLKITRDSQITSNTANTGNVSAKGGGIFNLGTFVDTSSEVLNQVVTGNQPDNVAKPPAALTTYYQKLYRRNE
ncbi:MAG: hypothetical protein ACRCYY_02800 [Trueperaceae bacterium]